MRRVDLVLLRELAPALHRLHEDGVHDDAAVGGARVQPRDQDGVLVHRDGLDVRRGTRHCIKGKGWRIGASTKSILNEAEITSDERSNLIIFLQRRINIGRNCAHLEEGWLIGSRNGTKIKLGISLTVLLGGAVDGPALEPRPDPGGGHDLHGVVLVLLQPVQRHLLHPRARLQRGDPL